MWITACDKERRKQILNDSKCRGVDMGEHRGVDMSKHQRGIKICARVNSRSWSLFKYFERSVKLISITVGTNLTYWN